MSRVIAVLMVALLGVALGDYGAHRIGLFGRDPAIHRFLVSPDERTVMVYGYAPGTVTVDETGSAVRLRVHTDFSVAIPVFGSVEGGSWMSAHLAAPLGARTLIDANEPDDALAVLRPAWLPPGYVHTIDSGTSSAGGLQVTSIYSSPTGSVLTITESPTPITAGPPYLAGAWHVDGHACTIAASDYGGPALTSDDVRRVAESVGP